MIFEEQRQPDDFIRLRDLFHIFYTKWRWFALSVFITVATAILYLLITPPVYTRTASVLIKDNSQSGSRTSDFSGFENLGIFTSNTNVNNELLTLKSPLLMQEVVNRLNLDTKYITQEGLRKIDLYKNTPVLVTFKNAPDSMAFRFDIDLQSPGKVRLYNFVQSGQSVPGEIESNLSDSISTPVGTLIITPTSHYKAEGGNRTVHFRKSNPEWVTNSYSAVLQAVLGNNNATVINLSIDDESPKRAADILATLIAVYNENWIKDKNQIAISTSLFINDRLNVIESELGNVDKDISSYKSENILPDVSAVSGMYLSQYAESKRELQELNNRLSVVQYISKNLSAEPAGQLLPANTGLDNSPLEKQISDYNSLLLRRNNLLANSSGKNPLVADMNQSLNEMSQSIIRSVDNVIATLNTQLANVKQQEARITGQIASNPNQARYLLSVERQQKVKEELYLYLLQKREENELSQAFAAYNTRTITPPYGPGVPTTPQRSKILLIALLTGLLLPMIIFVVREKINTTVRGRKDLEGMTIPFIGEIPLYCKRKKFYRKETEKREIVVKEKSRNVINEAFRVIRTNLEFMMKKENRAKVIMLTSINPDSGKTFITMNLAASFTIKRKKVLVIDLDMRKALLSGYIQSPKTGIADYLGHQLDDWRSVIVKGEIHAGPDVLPVGTIPPNPTELLFEERLGQMLTELRSEYDYIFIDCPPVEIVADTSIINQLVDMTLFVVRAGLFDRAMLPEVEHFYTSQKYKNMALILNGTVQADARYGYHRYGYSYGYAGGAGYTDDE
jgi:capsular exopolysaccharide family